MSAVALISELMMQSQVASAAQRAGVTLAVTSSPAALVAKSGELKPALVIVDLSHPGLDSAALMTELKAQLPDAITLAFGPHVHRGKLAAAEQAGFTHVMSRGQFHAGAEDLLRDLAGEN